MLLTPIPTDWILGLTGGLMIGGASALLLLGNGRILGASGILGGLVDGTGSNNAGERAVFLLGLIGAPALAVWVFGRPESHITGNLALLAVAGVLVGLGTRLANGCTSGHGVSGMSRFSPRSIVSTLIYLGVGFATFYVGRHIAGAF